MFGSKKREQQRLGEAATRARREGWAREAEQVARKAEAEARQARADYARWGNRSYAQYASEQEARARLSRSIVKDYRS